MKLSKILSKILYVYLFLVIILFAHYGESYLINIQSVLWIISLVLVLWFFLLTIRAKSEGLIVLLVSVSLVWYLARFLFLLASPKSIGFQSYFYLGVQDMNRGLAYLFWGTLLTGLGFNVGSALGYRKPRRQGDLISSATFQISLYRLTVFTIAIILIVFYNCYALGVGRFGGLYSSWLFRFIYLDSILLILVVITGDRWPFLRRHQKSMLLLTFTLFLVSKSLMFSRGAFYTLLIYGLFFIFAKKGDPVIRKKHLIIVFVFLLCSIVMYPITTATRSIWSLGRNRSISLTETLSSAKSAQLTVSSTLNRISYRLSALERVMVIVNEKGRNQSRYTNLDNVTKSIVNQSIPGTPFPEAMLTSQAFSLIYFKVPEESIRKGKALTSLWSFYGTCYAHFKWSGGLIATFLISFALAFGYQKLVKLKTSYNIFLRTWFIMLIYNVLLSYGIETWFLNSFYLMFAGAFYIVILSFHKTALKLLTHCFGPISGRRIRRISSETRVSV